MVGKRWTEKTIPQLWEEWKEPSLKKIWGQGWNNHELDNPLLSMRIFSDQLHMIAVLLHGIRGVLRIAMAMWVGHMLHTIWRAYL